MPLRICMLFLLAFVAGCSDPTPGDERVATADFAVITDCDYLNATKHPLPPVPIDMAREGVITDLSVVNDPCRTGWAAACPPGQLGAWTAGHLFNQMSGAPLALPALPAVLPPPPGLPVSRLIGEFIHTWEVPVSINGLVAPARNAPVVGVRDAVIDPWIRQTAATNGAAYAAVCFPGAPIVGAGSCPLDPRLAPFRLSAIVNRVDLGGDVDFVPAQPGEGRFVFGLFASENPPLSGVFDPLGPPQQFTLIFEYDLPSSSNTIAWANAFHALSSTPFGAAYNTALQGITDSFVLAGVEDGDPNQGSAIDFVRTNEIALAAPWELRAFQLANQQTGFNNYLLRMVPLEQTPPDPLNLTVELDAWQVAHEPDILSVEHDVPLGLPTGTYSLGIASTAPFIWDNGGTAGPFDPTARHLFGFATCNGCHTAETGGTPFVHVGPRPAAGIAPLSAFLAQTTAPGAPGFPAGFLSFTDPVVPTLTHSYNESWRRVCEIARLLANDPAPYTRPNGAH